MTRPEGDVVSALLWCLAGYDLDLQFFAQLREHLPEQKHAKACIYIERALRMVIGAKEDELMDAHPGYQETIHNTLGDTTETVRRAYDLHSFLITDMLTGYAMMLGSLTAYGQTPWTRYKTLVDEMWEARFAATPA